MANLPNQVNTFQDNWRFCVHCYSLWFNGYPTNGWCPSPDAPDTHNTGHPEHHGPSWDFLLPADTSHSI